jgi:RNA polymerase sigma-70 factor (ECF subfamily)
MEHARQLLQRYCREGDKSAFNSFYRSQADRLWRFLRFRGCSEQDAYDLLAEAFLKFIQVVCKDLRSPVALLYRIAVNLQIDAYRRRQTSPIIHDEQQVESRADSHAGAADEREFLRQLIKTLPESEQNLLLMRYWIGLTHKEIARALDSPEGTVRRQCSQAMKKLKKRWQEESRD